MQTKSQDPSTWEVKAGGPEGQEYLQLSSELKASLGYVRYCLKKEEGEEKKKKLNQGFETFRKPICKLLWAGFGL